MSSPNKEMDKGKPGQRNIIGKVGPRNIGSYSVSCSETKVVWRQEL